MSASRVTSGRILTTGGLADVLSASILSPATDRSDLSVFRLLLRMHRARATGMLGIAGGRSEIVVSLVQGRVVATADEARPTDVLLFEVLQREHLLSSDKLEAAVDRADAAGEDLGRAIFALRLLDARALARALKEAHKARLFEALDAREGTWTFARADVLGGQLHAGPVSLALDRVLSDWLHQALRSAYASDLEPLLAPASHLFLRSPPEARERAAQLGFGERELHTMELLLDGTRTPREVYALSVMSRNATARLLFMLFVFALVEGLREPVFGRAEETPAQRLRAQLARMQGEDLFARLGTHWANHPDEAGERYRELQARFGPGGEARRRGGEEAAIAAEIWALVEDAWSVLCDRAQRRAYRQTVVEAQQLEFSAELLWAHGKTAELCRELDEARRHYESAAELSKDEKYRQALVALAARVAAARTAGG